MGKLAVIKTGGKQYKVVEKQVLKIEKLDKKIGEAVELDTLLIADLEGAIIDLGLPLVKSAVEGKSNNKGN